MAQITRSYSSLSTQYRALPFVVAYLSHHEAPKKDDFCKALLVCKLWRDVINEQDVTYNKEGILEAFSFAREEIAAHRKFMAKPAFPYPRGVHCSTLADQVWTTLLKTHQTQTYVKPCPDIDVTILRQGNRRYAAFTNEPMGKGNEKEGFYTVGLWSPKRKEPRELFVTTSVEPSATVNGHPNGRLAGLRREVDLYHELRDVASVVRIYFSQEYIHMDRSNPQEKRAVKSHSFVSVFEFCDLGSLKDHAPSYREKSPLSKANMLGWMMQAVSRLHARNIVHRDLNLSNFMLKRDKLNGAVCDLKIGDFGLAHKLTNPKGDLVYEIPFERDKGPNLIFWAEPYEVTESRANQREDAYWRIFIPVGPEYDMWLLGLFATELFREPMLPFTHDQMKTHSKQNRLDLIKQERERRANGAYKLSAVPEQASFQKVFTLMTHPTPALRISDSHAIREVSLLKQKLEKEEAGAGNEKKKQPTAGEKR